MKKLHIIPYILFILLVLPGLSVYADLKDGLAIWSPYTPKSHVYKGQMHAHTINSDGAQSPTNVVIAYRDAGYDFISITDHNYNTPDPGVFGILFIPGIEQQPAGNHLNRINATTAPARTAQGVIDQALSEGSFVFLNHPNWPGGYPNNPNWTDTELESVSGYHGIEVWNSLVSPNENAEGRIDYLLSKHLKCYLIATDDCHNVNALYSKTASTRVFADNLTISEIMENLKRGNFYASNGANISSITVSERTITITTDVASTIDFITNGGTVKQSTANTISSSYTASGEDVYIRARVTRGSDGKKAWTNPIYVSTGPITKLTNDDNLVTTWGNLKL